MILETERLRLRPWKESDAKSLYFYARDPDVGPIAGWPVHTSVENSRDIIQNVLNGPLCFAICLKETDEPIGSIELLLNGFLIKIDSKDECELGYWIGKPHWQNGYVTEASRELIRYAFETLNMKVIWCGYYDGNIKSKKAQEKVGFVYHHTCIDSEVPAMNEKRIGHASILTKEHWKSL